MKIKELYYKPSFIRELKKLLLPLQIEAKEKIILFRKDSKHPFLKTHKLKGKLAGYWSFSVNYAYRIVFNYIPNNQAVLLAIGNHDIYK